MSKTQKFVLGSIAGSIIVYLGMFVSEEVFWSNCGNIDVHEAHEIWACRNFFYIYVLSSIAAGFVSGLIYKSKGVVLGIVTPLLGFIAYSLLVRFPFGNDHTYTLIFLLLFFLLPCVISCIVSVKLTGRTWKNAL